MKTISCVFVGCLIASANAFDLHISKLDEITRDVIKQTYNDAPVFQKWSVDLNQRIKLTDEYETLVPFVDPVDDRPPTSFNVKTIVAKYAENDEMADQVDIAVIRAAIRDAIRVSGYAYTNLFAFLMLQDLAGYKTELEAAGAVAEQNKDVRYQVEYEKQTEDYRAHYAIDTTAGNVRLSQSATAADGPIKMEPIWMSMIARDAELEIYYEFYEDLYTLYNPDHAIPKLVVDLHEIICALNSLMAYINMQVPEISASDPASFVSMYGFLGEELGEPFMDYLWALDKKEITNHKTNLKPFMVHNVPDSLPVLLPFSPIYSFKFTNKISTTSVSKNPGNAGKDFKKLRKRLMFKGEIKERLRSV